MKVDITYFTLSGIRRARGSYFSPQSTMVEIWREVEMLRERGELPQLNNVKDVHMIVSCPSLSPHPRLLLAPILLEDTRQTGEAAR